MQLKVDKFTWAVILVVAALLIAAVVTVNRTGGQDLDNLAYRTDDTLLTPIHNAFVAFERGDLSTARQQYSQRLLASMEEGKEYNPFTSGGYVNAQNSRRLRILNSQIDATDPDRASATIAVDNYSSGGFFSGSNTWSSQRVIALVREDNAWKIDTPEYFNY
jgi:hypothetical protein